MGKSNPRARGGATEIDVFIEEILKNRLLATR
jgi:hypothetical protein